MINMKVFTISSCVIEVYKHHVMKDQYLKFKLNITNNIE